MPSKRRGNGQGSEPRKLKSGSWQIQYTGSDGIRRSITRKTKAEVAKAQTEMLAAINSNTWRPPDSESQTVAEYIEDWMMALKSRPKDRHLKPATMEMREYVIPQYVLRTLYLPNRRGTICLGDIPITAVNPQTIRRWLSAVQHDIRARGEKRLNKPLSNSYGDEMTKKVYRTVRAMFSDALRQQVITAMPCIESSYGSSERAERTPITGDAIQQLADNMPPQYGAAVWISATAGGLRISEVLALRRKDIEISKDSAGQIVGGWVHVTRSSYWARGASEPVYTTPKTKAGIRVAPMPPGTAKIVAGHLAFFVVDDPDALLFTGKDGQPMRRDVLQRAFTRARTRIGHPEYVFHGLRYGYASALASANIPVRDIQAVVGHSTPAMTNHYCKPLPESLERIARVQAEVLGQ